MQALIPASRSDIIHDIALLLRGYRLRRITDPYLDVFMNLKKVKQDSLFLPQTVSIGTDRFPGASFQDIDREIRLGQT
ncbi:hypothetical protein D3C84_1211100 [compost metagenome]